MTSEVHESGPWTCSYLQWWEICSKAAIHNLLQWVYHRYGAHPVPAKISIVHVMPTLVLPTYLQEFLDMVTYLSPLKSSLSSSTALPLWGTEEEQKVHLEPVLPGCIWYYKMPGMFWLVPLVLWCLQTTFNPGRSLEEGAESVLLQDGHLADPTFKALTSVLQYYANIKWELLTFILIQ